MAKKLPEVAYLLQNDSDFVHLIDYDYSLSKVIKKYPNGAPKQLIAAALDLKTEEVDEVLKTVMIKMRQMLSVEVDED